MLDVGGLIAFIYRAKFVCMTVILLSGALGLGASYLFEPKYLVEVLLAQARQQNQTGGIGDLLSQVGGPASLAGLVLGSDQDSSESIALLSSRKLTSDFIVKNNLLPVLFSDKWDDDKQDWDVLRPSNIPSIADALELFNEDIRTVEVDQRTGLITLSILWKDAQQAADWASGMVHMLNSTMRVQAIDEASKSLEFLHKEAESTSILGVKQAIYALVEQEVGRIMLANVKEEYVLRIIDPAVIPDSDEYVWPSRILFIILGGLLGFCLVFLMAYVRLERPLVVAA